MAKNRALGKGLGALFTPPSQESSPPEGREEQLREGAVLPLDEIIPNPNQPRRTMDEEGIEALARSIGTHGVVQPLVVRRREEGDYELIAGERRWRAARRAGLKEVPVRMVEGTDLEMMEISLIENIQREDLAPLEVAGALSDLLEIPTRRRRPSPDNTILEPPRRTTAPSPAPRRGKGPSLVKPACRRACPSPSLP
ncbi:hypothetical protein MASR1M66_15010 [Aminivibrio sp.]